MIKPILHFLKLENLSILEQLKIEEALLRRDHRNWCLVNSGSTPAIVMGISGKPDQLINRQIFSKSPVPIIRRFSGGGTVFINEETVFTAFICNSEELHVSCHPHKIFKWSEKIYQPVFQGIDFKLQENDYVIGDQKFGGNAQYLRRNRWLHHTSLLFDYDINQMNYLSFPEKVPKYREKRNHDQFLYRLNHHFSSKDELRKKIEHSLNHQFHIEEVKLEEIKGIISLPHRKSTKLISF